MGSSDNISNKNSASEKWRDVYSNSENLVELKFSNVTDSVKYIWVEPVAYSIELKPKTEYRLVTHERHFSIEYTSDSQFTLWLGHTFGFKLYKKEDNTNAESWIVDIDMSGIQFEV